MRQNKTRMLVMAALLVVAFCATVTTATAYTYNGEAAANYAYNNAYNNVPGSWYFELRGSGDCTNFVSHSLQAGGWREIYPRIWENWKSYNVWYYDGCFKAQHSNSWASANDLYRFMLYSPRATSVGSAYQLTKGDIFQIDFTNDGTWDHSLIVTDADSRGPLMCGHTRDMRNEPLVDIMNRNPGARFAAWHIASSYSR